MVVAAADSLCDAEADLHSVVLPLPFPLGLALGNRGISLGSDLFQDIGQASLFAAHGWIIGVFRNQLTNDHFLDAVDASNLGFEERIPLVVANRNAVIAGVGTRLPAFGQ